MTSHEPFDDSTKAFYRQLFESWGMAVETERTVFFRERSIDLVVRCSDSDQERLQSTVFSHFKHLNAVELKGINDPLTVLDYNRIMMRAWGLGAIQPNLEEETEEESEERTEEEIEPNETDETKLNRLPNRRTLTIVCVSRPNNILNQLNKQIRFVKTHEPGIYHCPEGFSQWIICPSELALIEKNYPLLPLARGDKLAQFMALCFNEGRSDYLRLIMDIGLYTDSNAILQQILEANQMKPQKLNDETRLRLDQYFRETPDEMLKMSIFQEVLKDSQRLAELRGVYQGIQKTLIRQLQRKFTALPDSVVKKVKTTHNVEKLENWLDQVIAAKTLTDTGLVD